MVDSVVPQLLRNMGISKLDLTDAFLCWPVHVRDCEVRGFRHLRTGEVYRYRYMPFGLKQAPGVQQRWARVIMEIIRRQGLRYLSPECPVSRPGGLLALGGYLDDFALGHAPSLSSWEWCLQYHWVQRVMAYYGMPVKHVKNEWPATCCEYTGLVLDTAAGELRLSAERQAKLRSLLELYIHLGSQGGSVPRLELASVIGKLQFCCLAVLPGQARMRALYVARDTRMTLRWRLRRPCCRMSSVSSIYIDTEALEALRWWHSRMVSGGRPRRLLWGEETRGCLWRQVLPPCCSTCQAMTKWSS